jgi:hypothetical protein
MDGNSRVAKRGPAPVDIPNPHPPVEERHEAEAVAGLVAGCVLDADLEHVVGEVLEAAGVEERALATERVAGRLAGESEKLLAGKAVVLERVGGGSHARSIGSSV